MHELVVPLGLRIVGEVCLDLHDGQHLVRCHRQKDDVQQELPREVVILLILVDGAEHDLVPQGNLILFLGKALSLRFFRPFNENDSLDFSYDSYIFCSGFTG